jgi:hypothetical protein
MDIDIVDEIQKRRGEVELEKDIWKEHLGFFWVYCPTSTPTCNYS